MAVLFVTQSKETQITIKYIHDTEKLYVLKHNEHKLLRVNMIFETYTRAKYIQTD